MIDILRKRGFPVRAYNGSRRPRAPRRFANARAETYWTFRELLRTGRATLPSDPKLEEEALAVEWQINTSGQIQIVGKDLIRKELGRSPDRLDAVVVGLAKSAGLVLGGPSVKVTAFQL